MRKLFIAFDGVEFEDEEECRKYEEAAPPAFKMWDIHGNLTEDVCEGYYVYIPFISDTNVNTRAEEFLKKCDAEDVLCDGIEPESSGFYMWSEYEEGFLSLDKCIIHALQKIGNPYAED